MAFKNFKRDLLVAQKTEQDCANLLQRVKGYKTVNYNNDNQYDLQCIADDGCISTYEVKEDFSCRKTGNVALEFHSRGKDSGIAVSKADFYLYRLHRPDRTVVHIEIPIMALKAAVAGKKYFRVISGGDAGSNTYCYLFKLEEFLKFGNILE